MHIWIEKLKNLIINFIIMIILFGPWIMDLESLIRLFQVSILNGA